MNQDVRRSVIGAAATAAVIPGLAAATTPSAPVVRLAELEIDPAQLEAYTHSLAVEIETSVRVEPGVLSLSAVSVKGKPTSVRIMEVYADQAAYEAHIHSAHFLKYKADTATMIQSLVLLEGDVILLRSKSGVSDQSVQL